MATHAGSTSCRIRYVLTSVYLLPDKVCVDIGLPPETGVKAGPVVTRLTPLNRRGSRLVHLGHSRAYIVITLYNLSTILKKD